MKRSPLKKKSKSETARLQTKCDAMLTPIIKKLHPRCEACGSDTQVAHHWIEKSRSSNLRYNTDNLIPLCNPCHYKIHNRNGSMIMTSHDIVDDIIQKRGIDWHERMKLDGRIVVKTNVEWYKAHLDRLQMLLDSI